MFGCHLRSVLAFLLTPYINRGRLGPSPSCLETWLMILFSVPIHNNIFDTIREINLLANYLVIFYAVYLRIGATFFAAILFHGLPDDDHVSEIPET